MTTRWQITFVLVDDDDSPATALEVQNWLATKLATIAEAGTVDAAGNPVVISSPYGVEDGVIAVMPLSSGVHPLTDPAAAAPAVDVPPA